MGFLSDVEGGLENAWKGITGDPAGIKAAYDKQIQASKEAQAQLQAFLMGREANAQAVYGPISQMYQSAYGSQGMRAPMIPGQNGPIQSLYTAPAPSMSAPQAAPNNFNFQHRQIGAK